MPLITIPSHNQLCEGMLYAIACLVVLFVVLFHLFLFFHV
jgi:hypothetical protein